MFFHAFIDEFVIGMGRILECHSPPAQDIDSLVDVRRSESDVLDALAFILAQELLDLALVVLALVQGDPDLAAGAGHGLREEAGLLPLDVKIADFAEVEEPFVEIGPEGHAPPVNVVGQMVDIGQLAVELIEAIAGAWSEIEIDLVYRPLVAIPVDEEQARAADPLDRRYVHLAMGDVAFHPRGAELDRALERR